MHLPFSFFNRSNTNSQPSETDFDKWVKTKVKKWTNKNLHPFYFPEGKTAIQIKATGKHEGVFYILVENTPQEKNITVEPYNYADYNLNIEGNWLSIKSFLKRHTLIINEVENNRLTVNTRNGMVGNIPIETFIKNLSDNMGYTPFYSLLSTNLYTNFNFILFVISIACFLCGVLSLLIYNDIHDTNLMNASGILFGIGLASFPLIAKSDKDKLSEVFSNFAILFIVFIIFYLIFYKLYKDYNNKQSTCIIMITCLFITCLCVCYVICFAIYKFWTFFNHLFNKLFAFKKAEDNDSYQLQVRNEMLLKLCAIATTVFAIIATATPVIASVIELLNS